MPNGTFFRLEVGFSPTHVDANSITAKTMDGATELDPSLREHEARAAANILTAIRRLAELIEQQGLSQSIIYDGEGRQIGQYFCRFRPE